MSLSRAMGGGDGLVDYALRLDTEGKAVLEAALGPLSVPRPGEGVADLRPVSQRRAEALVELVRRAVSAPEGAPTATKATLFVTLSWEDLVAQLRAGAVVGSSDGGTVLAPGDGVGAGDGAPDGL